nr:GNAT family N-acetyltransferase [Nannocystis sp. RBIL2]
MGLRPLELDDAAWLARASEGEPPAGGAIPRPDADAEAWVREELRRRGAGEAFVFVAVAAGVAVGTTRLARFAPDRRGAQLSYWIAAAARQRGHATAAAGLTLAFARAELGLGRVCSYVARHNHASRVVLEKNSFVRTAVGRARQGGAIVERYERCWVGDAVWR